MSSQPDLKSTVRCGSDDGDRKDISTPDDVGWLKEKLAMQTEGKLTDPVRRKNSFGNFKVSFQPFDLFTLEKLNLENFFLNLIAYPHFTMFHK